MLQVRTLPSDDWFCPSCLLPADRSRIQIVGERLVCGDCPGTSH